MTRTLQRLRWRLKHPSPGARLSRRQFLQLSAWSAAAVTFAACVSETSEAPLLRLHNWPEYVNPDNITKFTETTGITVNESYFESNEDLIKNLTNNPTDYDVVAPSNYIVPRLIQSRGLLRLDQQQLPNFGNLQQRFREDRAYDPGSVYTITKNWGITGLMWNTTFVTETLMSWADVWALAAKYSGRVAVVEASDEIIGAALKLLGYSYNDADPAHIAAAGDKLMDIRPHVSIMTDYFDKFANKSIVLAIGWNGDAFIIRDTYHTPLQFAIPVEGSLLWEDDWAIPANAPHPKNAHRYINYLLDPQVAAAESSFIGYGTAVEAAIDLLPEAVRNDPTLYPPDDVMARLEQLAPFSPESQAAREAVWDKFVNG
jgi:spermidine/putrescine transport system substrate-binding protein